MTDALKTVGPTKPAEGQAMDEDRALSQRIAEKTVAVSHLSCWWLGGSGFVLKSSSGTVIYIDPYLSNSVKGIFGVERAFPPPIVPEDVRAAAVVSTHWHEDHLDPGSIPVIAKHNPDARFIMPPSATAHAMSWKVPRSQVAALQHGQSINVNDVQIEATPARHEAGIPGWEVPDAMGVLLHADGIVVYHCGDTEYDVRLRRLKSNKPDVALLCINGVSGNMDAYEAALLAWHLNARVVVPIHHFLWATNSGIPEETLDPAIFRDTYLRLGGTGRVVLPQVGEEISIGSEPSARGQGVQQGEII